MKPQIVGYTCHYMIGQGAHGKVYKYTRGDKQFAVKFTTKKNEVQSYNEFQSQYIQKCLKTVTCGKKTAIFFQMATMDLEQKISFEKIPKYRLYKYFRQIGLGIADLHEFGRIHGDIKLKNILYFSNTDSVVLCDLGLSHSQEDLKQNYFDVAKKQDVRQYVCLILNSFGFQWIYKHKFVNKYGTLNKSAVKAVEEFFDQNQSNLIKKVMKQDENSPTMRQFIRQFGFEETQNHYIDKYTEKVYYSKALFKARKKIKKRKEKDDKIHCKICFRRFSGKNMPKHVRSCQRKHRITAVFRQKGFCSLCKRFIPIDRSPYRCCLSLNVSKTLTNTRFPNPFRQSRGNGTVDHSALNLPELSENKEINEKNYQYTGNVGKFKFKDSYLPLYVGEIAKKLDILKKRQSALPLIVKQSTIKGIGDGVFATKDLPQNTLLCWYLGQVVDINQYDAKENNNSLLDIGGTQDAFFMIAPKRITNIGRFINSSKNPNALCRICLVKLEEIQLCVFLYSCKIIKKDQQIFWNYGPRYFDRDGVELNQIVEESQETER